MAQGTIRKGFFFYFGLFVLLLVAVFLVCVVIMIFNPGKSILWLQYFTNNTTYEITKTTKTDEQAATEINWLNVENLEINCSYANVIIETDNNKLKKNALYITNGAKGFTAAKGAVHFNYSVIWEGNTLKVNVTEPEGFIYFSKKIDIVLHANSVGNDNFNNLNVKVHTQNGNVSLGGSALKTTGAPKTSLKSIDVSTEKGDIYATQFLNVSSLSSLNLETKSGNITSYCPIGSSTGLDLHCNASLSTTTGLISLNTLSTTGNLELTCKRGNIKIVKLSANKIDCVACVRGNYVFDEVYGDLSFTNSEDSLISPIITVKKLNGNFSLSADTQQDGSPEISIDEISGKLFVFNANKGSLNVQKAKGQIEVFSAGKLSTNICVADGNANTISIINGSGSVNLGFAGSVSQNVTVRTGSGSVGINVTKKAKFVANMYKNNESNDVLPDDKISVNIGKTITVKNPLTVTEGSGATGQIDVYTNSKVSVNLVEVAAE